MTNQPPQALSAHALDPTPHTVARRDGFLDAIKAIALWRVVVWHALAWPWLSWFAAMPAMFYVAGVLLQQSLAKHGYTDTLRSRLRRLLVPFWAFGAVAAAIMIAAGWRPGLTDLVWWIVPIGDPVGFDSTPGLWIPLWYLRAYLWVLVGAVALSWACRRFGLRALTLPAVATMAVWAWQSAGHDVPLAIADIALFPFFVMAGMLTTLGSLDLTVRRSTALALGAGALALIWYHLDGAPMGIVNGSLPLHLLVGVATVSVLATVRRPLAEPRPLVADFVRWSSSRALTIYLWHGFGLFVADRLVYAAGWPSLLSSAAGLAVVVTVTLASAAVFGSLEDRSARRAPRRAPRVLRTVVVPGALLTVAALLSADVGIDGARIVPSGQVVMARAGAAEVTEGSLSDVPARGSEAGRLDEAALDEVFQRWLDDNSTLLDSLDTSLVEVALVDGNDEVVLLQWNRDGGPTNIEPFPWWSMSKTMTAAWMMQLADEGVIELDGSLIEHLAMVPHSDEFTFEQLAGHRAGVPGSLDSDLLTATPIDEIGAYFESPDLAYPPGEGYDYSRVGYYLLTWGLEEASGLSWREAMEDIASAAGVSVVIDEDLVLSDRVTHPGEGDYRGSLWGAGGLLGTTIDGARLFRWTLMESLTEAAVQRMATSSREHEYYGLGLAPFCPCVSDGDRLVSERVGLSTITGTYVVDLAHDIGLMLRTDNWWSDEGPAIEFDDLLRALLDTVDG
jgi:CubicO group peptidase (beta-lactamase class C family)/peptidoglycan/LPS O-acetylase OafA/YrhL